MKYTKTILFNALVLAGFSSVSMAQSETAKSAVLFENVRVFNGTSQKLSEPSYVWVEGNLIKKISKKPMVIEAADTIRIQGQGRTLMPGLIDNHVHIIMGSSTMKELLDPTTPWATLEAHAAEEAQKMLLRGFTTMRDVGGPTFELKHAIDTGASIGPRIYPSGAMISQTSGHGDSRLPNEKSRRFFGKVSHGELLGVDFIADGRDEVLTATRENLRFGASQIKMMAGGGAASAYDPLDVTQYTLDELKAGVEAASDWGTYVLAHAYTPKAVQRALDAGVKNIEHGQLLDENTMKLMAKKGAWLGLQTLEEAHPPEPASTIAKKHEVILGTDKAFTLAKKYKVKLAWGTDFLFKPSNYATQNKNLTELTKWFTPAEALKMVTHDNAQLLALSGMRNPYPGKLGVVEEGALADLLLVKGDPTKDLNVIADPENNFSVIMKDGKIYKNTP